MSLSSVFQNGLAKTRYVLSNAFSGSNEIDDDFMEELEEALILSDTGITTTQKLIKELNDSIIKKQIHLKNDAKQELKDIIASKFDSCDFVLDMEPSVITLIGVNGVGKTTSLGKIAYYYKNQNRKPLICAADTFRAAAVDQLQVWAERADVPIISNENSSDPSSVIFDAIKSYQAKDYDLLLIDTAGRLHNKTNLMNELEKMNKIIDRELKDTHKETILVLDATTGQNAISQMQAFSEVANITGIILTKLDGTAKGGIAIALADTFHKPIYFIGLGETIETFQRFDANSFSDSLIE